MVFSTRARGCWVHYGRGCRPDAQGGPAKTLAAAAAKAGAMKKRLVPGERRRGGNKMGVSVNTRSLEWEGSTIHMNWDFVMIRAGHQATC